MLQQVDGEDGVTLVGGPAREILERDDGGADGTLVEAPSLVKLDGAEVEERYVLFYSSHCYNTPEYDVKYAMAKSIRGPYTKKGQLLGAKSEDLGGLVAPGGATSVAGGGRLVFHADCDVGRCIHGAEYVVEDEEIKIVG